MPRELSLLAPEPATAVDLVDLRDRAVVSVELSSPVQVAVDVERLTVVRVLASMLAGTLVVAEGR